MKVLFICHANVCRSFMAQEICKTIRPDIQAFSRGLYANPFYEVPDKVTAFLRSRGIVAGPHTPTQLSDPDLQAADYVFVMEPAHLEQILDRYAQYTDKCYLLLDFAYGKEEALEDPICLEGKPFNKQALILAQAVAKALSRLPGVK